MRREGYIIEEMIEYFFSICSEGISDSVLREPVVRGQGRDDSCSPIGEDYRRRLPLRTVHSGWRLPWEGMKNTVKNVFCRSCPWKTASLCLPSWMWWTATCKNVISGQPVQASKGAVLMIWWGTDLQAHFTHTSLTSVGFTSRGNLLCGASGGV